VERRIAALPMLILGIVLIAAGMGTVGLAANVPLLLASVFVVSLGTVLTRPGEQTVSANLADPVARGSYFGVASLSLAVGGGLGNFTGGLIYDFGQNTNRPALPWIVFLLVGLTAAAGLWRSRVVIDRLAAERLAASGDEAPA
jgi:DHA1 family multidrug resistance protein-like MFS transporter